MAATDPNELVEINHPKLHSGDDAPTAFTTRAAYEETWKAAGYRLVPGTSTSTPKEK
jgi:hypothetical protein